MHRFIIPVILLFSVNVWSQAFCGLRDPVAMIEKLYPSYTSYQSIVRTVDERTREVVSKELPGMVLHFGELGRHTLYVVTDNDGVLGLVHVRSEQSQWGLVEIAWGISKDLKIDGFAFQRCRSADKYKLEVPKVQVLFSGKRLDDLKAYYDFEVSAPTQTYTNAIGYTGELGEVLLKCGMKTLLVTDLVWWQDIDTIESSFNTFEPN